MECYIPLNRSIPSHDIASLRESAELRKFLIFDEDLKLVLHSKSEDRAALNKFSIWINDTKVHESDGTRAFNPVEGQIGTWELKANVCSQSIFRSSVVMNNGRNNQIRFRLEYNKQDEIELINSRVTSSMHLETEEEEDFLPSFEALSTKSINRTTEMKAHEAEAPRDQKQPEILCLEYPVYSLLNMRLRNASQKSRGFIISSLDLQTSKASIQFAKIFLSPTTESGSFQLHFDELTYELVDRGSHIKMDPICPFELPFVAEPYDGFNVCYKLPIIPDSSSHPSMNRALITLRYNLVSLAPQLAFSIAVKTTWETDVTLKRPMSNSMISQASSNISTPRLYGVSPRISLMGSASSLVNSKLSNVKFKFINHKITALRGEKFTMRLQIANSSSSSLDMVVYYNNKLSPPSQPSNSLSLENQYQLYKRYRKVTEGIVLLSNDYKVPIVGPNETYYVDLNFVGIMSGYYSTLPGLKMVDLQTNELIEIGMGASVLIK